MNKKKTILGILCILVSIVFLLAVCALNGNSETSYVIGIALIGACSIFAIVIMVFDSEAEDVFARRSHASAVSSYKRAHRDSRVKRCAALAPYGYREKTGDYYAK